MGTRNAKKGCLNLSAKLEWLCLQHRQAWSRPQSPVKWEYVETGQGWMLRWSSSVERTYRECERPGTAEGGGQNQPVCTSTVLWEPVSSITGGPAKLTYPAYIALVIASAVYPWIFVKLLFSLHLRQHLHPHCKKQKNTEKMCEICHLKGVFGRNFDRTGGPFYVLYHWTFNGNIFAIKTLKMVVWSDKLSEK